MMIACGFAEDGKRRKKSWSIERRALRRLKHPRGRLSRTLLEAVGRIAQIDELTRLRARDALFGLAGRDAPRRPF